MGIVAIAIGVGFIWLSRFTYRKRIQQLQDARNKLTWPEVSGVITSSRVNTVESESTGSDGTTETTTSYVPEIRYQYTAHGTTCTGSRIHVLEDTAFGNHQGAAAVCARYPVGSTLNVHVGPTPEDGAYLNGDINEASEKLMAIALAGFFALAGLGFIAFGVLLVSGAMA